jgi:hypothetical protein
VEQTVQLSPDDSALRELKHRILRAIAELETNKSKAA